MVYCKKNKSPHPRDGAWAWLVCISSTIVFAFLFGYMLSFGVFLPVLSKHFNSNRGSTAWIGSLAIGSTFFFGPLAVKVINLVGERTVSVCGALVASSLMATGSFVNNIVILYFSHGVLFGICGSFIFNALLLSVRKYFKDKLAVAIGLASSGASFGLLSIGPLLHVLIESLGWRGAFRVMAGVMVLVALLSLTSDPNVEEDEPNTVITCRPRQSQGQCNGLVDCSMWSSPRYIAGITVSILIYFGLFVPTIHLIRFAEDRDMPSSKSSQLFIYIGVCSTITRLVIGKMIDKRWLTPMQGLQFSAFTVGVCTIFLTQATAYYHFVLFAVGYGIGSGAFTTTSALFFLTCFDDVNKASVSLGTSLTLSAITLLAGPPVAGFIADQFGSYQPAFYIFGGIVAFAGFVPFCLLCGPQANEPREIKDLARLRLVGYRLATVDSSNRYSTYIDDGVRV